MTDPVPLLTQDALKERLYLSPAELATITPLSEWTIRRAIHEGELKAIRIRRRWLIAKEDARQWLAEHGTPNT